MHALRLRQRVRGGRHVQRGQLLALPLALPLGVSELYALALSVPILHALALALVHKDEDALKAAVVCALVGAGGGGGLATVEPMAVSTHVRH